MYMCLQCISSPKFYVSKVFSSQTLFNITIKYVKCTYMLVALILETKYEILNNKNTKFKLQRDEGIFWNNTANWSCFELQKPELGSDITTAEDEYRILQEKIRDTDRWRKSGSGGILPPTAEAIRGLGAPTLIFRIEVLGKAISCILRASHRH